VRSAPCGHSSGREPTLERSRGGQPADSTGARGTRCSTRVRVARPTVGEAEDAVFGDFVAGDDPLPEEEVEVSLRSQALTAALLSLQERERQVLVLRYGLDDSGAQDARGGSAGARSDARTLRQIELESLRRFDAARDAVRHCITRRSRGQSPRLLFVGIAKAMP